jgi:hypothetical protein
MSVSLWVNETNRGNYAASLRNGKAARCRGLMCITLHAATLSARYAVQSQQPYGRLKNLIINNKEIVL